MSDSVALIVVAANAHLGREVATKLFAQPIRLRSLAGVPKKLEEHPAAFLLLEWNSDDGETPLLTLSILKRNFPAFRFAVFCPDFAERMIADVETLRLLLLENGATAVFANRRELAGLSVIVRRHFDEHPQPVKDRIREIHEFLPWN
jgi:hypothetical protein